MGAWQGGESVSESKPKMVRGWEWGWGRWSCGRDIICCCCRGTEASVS